jgi:hypothetical protein
MPEIAGSGMDFRQLMSAKLGPVPVPLVIITVVAGVGYLIYKRNKASSGGNQGLGNNGTPPDPRIDPTTGVPWDIENQINPNTGLPNYYGGPGIDTGANAGASGSGGPINEIPPGPTGPASPYPGSPGPIGPTGPASPYPGSPVPGVIQLHGYRPGDPVPAAGAPIPGNFPKRGVRGGSGNPVAFEKMPPIPVVSPPPGSPGTPGSPSGGGMPTSPGVGGLPGGLPYSPGVEPPGSGPFPMRWPYQSRVTGR